MAQFSSIFENLILQYKGYFDIERPHIFLDQEILGYGCFHQRMARYVLVRRAQMYAMEINEHTFFVHVPHLNMAAWEFEKSRIIKAESEYVTPHREHMYTYMTLILLADAVDEDVKNDLRKLRYTKNYQFALKGYSTVRVVALNLATEEIIYNARGKEVKKVIEQALHM